MVDDTTSVLRSSGVSVRVLLRSPATAACWRPFICAWVQRPDLSTLVIIVVQTRFGLHIIKLVNREAESVVPIDDVTDDARLQLSRNYRITVLLGSQFQPIWVTRFLPRFFRFHLLTFSQCGRGTTLRRETKHIVANRNLRRTKK